LDAAADLVLFAHLVHPEWDDHGADSLLARCGVSPGDDAASAARAVAAACRRLVRDAAEEGEEALAELSEGLEAAGLPEHVLVEGVSAAPRRHELPAADPLLGPARDDARSPDEPLPVEDGALLRF